MGGSVLLGTNVKLKTKLQNYDKKCLLKLPNRLLSRYVSTPNQSTESTDGNDVL